MLLRSLFIFFLLNLFLEEIIHEQSINKVTYDTVQVTDIEQVLLPATMIIKPFLKGDSAQKSLSFFIFIFRNSSIGCKKQKVFSAESCRFSQVDSTTSGHSRSLQANAQQYEVQ